MSQIMNDKKMHNIYEAANMNFSYLRLQAHCFFNFKISLMPELHGSPFLQQGDVRSSTLLDQLPKVKALLYLQLTCHMTIFLSGMNFVEWYIYLVDYLHSQMAIERFSNHLY